MMAGVSASGITKKTRAYFLRRQLLRISRREPSYDIDAAVGVIRDHLPEPSKFDISDQEIRLVLITRDEIINTDQGFQFSGGRVLRLTSLHRRLSEKGVQLPEPAIEAVLDAELHYLHRRHRI